MKRGRLFGFGLGLALIGSQAGHLVAYQLRYGEAALQLQGTGAHSYFPLLLKTGLGAAALFGLFTVFIVGLARLGGGRRIVHQPAPSLTRLVALLFSVQLLVYFVQETAETALGAPATSPVALVMWGAVGQLPVALLVGLALRWIAVELEPALAGLADRPGPVIRLVPAVDVVDWPCAAVPAVAVGPVASGFNRRGPPF